MAKNVTLDWTDPSPTTYVNQLEIWRKVDGGTYTHIGGAQLGDETYDDDSGVTDTTKYYYEVRAYNIDRNYSVVESNITITTGAGYLLDTYTGAAAAYSLRKLRTGETSAIKVRRSSDNATTDILLETSGSITLSSYITGGTTTFSTWVGSGSSFVETWYDQSGNSNDITQTTTTKQPRITNGGVLDIANSLSGIKFDGTDDYLSIASNSTLQIIGNMSAYSVVNPLAISTVNEAIFIKRIDDNNREFEFRYKSLETRYLDDNNSIGYVNSNSNIQYLKSFDRTVNANVIVYKNSSNSGSQSLTGTQATTTADFVVGGRSTQSFLNGYIQEIILFDSNKSSDRTAITSNINTHYSIY